ncbi:hypothetical protein GGTG_06026 [Gaeumannomyces tritici R3-111a-1]|uniref:Uncharacterized protein n=1 Tax=Gaeumannomyces tritici (strain R3-111a-1) TaxID=644352 RepID=J3NXM0_GAET3|nr:hypothetical protein GGTG_06026 [Gaeumannomyces tritici R3-111a-1]EJT76102.1 hypothetical protein GGTG_06026 [Gaeumannomyces tritici R3-111a-1]
MSPRLQIDGLWGAKPATAWQEAKVVDPNASEPCLEQCRVGNSVSGRLALCVHVKAQSFSAS